MSKLKLNIGGELETGDIVGIAYNNCVVFGWFVDQGVNGSLKFIPLAGPERHKQMYDDYINDISPNAWTAKRFAKGFTFKNIMKDYIITFGAHDNRAFKIAEPEKFFKDSVQEKIYDASKQILTNLNFPAK